MLLNLFFLSTCFLVAQSVDQQENMTWIRISMADTRNNSFLLNQEKLKEILGIFQNDELHEIRLNYQEEDNESWYSEYYDMNFEGDVYVFKKKYKNSVHFLKPKIDIQNIDGRAVSYINSKQLVTVIREDSVIFNYRLEHLGEDTQKNILNRNKLGVPARYFGDLEKLSSRIAEQLSREKPITDVDSIVVFRGVVDVQGDMTSLILEAGERSLFADKVEKALSSPQTTRKLRDSKHWVPARISRGAVKSNIRIYARLHKDGSVTMSTPRVLGTISVLD